MSASGRATATWHASQWLAESMLSLKPCETLQSLWLDQLPLTTAAPLESAQLQERLQAAFHAPISRYIRLVATSSTDTTYLIQHLQQHMNDTVAPACACAVELHGLHILCYCLKRRGSLQAERCGA